MFLSFRGRNNTQTIRHTKHFFRKTIFCGMNGDENQTNIIILKAIHQPGIVGQRIIGPAVRSQLFTRARH